MLGEAWQKCLDIAKGRPATEQLHPERSTDAFVLHHPEAEYFNV